MENERRSGYVRQMTTKDDLAKVPLVSFARAWEIGAKYGVAFEGSAVLHITSEELLAKDAEALRDEMKKAGFGASVNVHSDRPGFARVEADAHEALPIGQPKGEEFEPA